MLKLKVTAELSIHVVCYIFPERESMKFDEE